MDLNMKGRMALIRKLPDKEREAIEQGLRTGEYETEQYKAAMGLFFRRHVCRLEPWPEDVMAMMKTMSEDKTSHENMYAFSLLRVLADSIGTEKSGSGLRRLLKVGLLSTKLKNIEAPTLLYNGEHDGVPNIAMEPAFREIPKVKWVTIEDASHTCLAEKREKTIGVIADFLAMC